MVEKRESLPPLLKERWLLDQVSPDERARVESQLSESERARLRMEHEALRAELFARLPAERFAQRVQEKVNEQRTARPSSWLPYLGMVACAALALLVFAPREPGEISSQPDRGERAKGIEPTLHIYRKRGEEAEQLPEGALLSPHDVLQLGYVAAGYTHAVLLSIDGRGQVTLHAPSEAKDSTRLPPGQGEHLLEQAYELDDAPSFERFFLVVSRAPLDAGQLLQEAQSLVKKGQAERELLIIPADTRQFAITFPKRSP